MCDCGHARVGLRSCYTGEGALAGEEEGKWEVSEEGGPGGAAGGRVLASRWY